MPPTTTALPLPDVPLDVAEFAAARRVTHHLRPILTLAREVFPEAPVRIYAEDDPEIPDERYLVVEVRVPGWTVEELVAARDRWGDEKSRLVPGHDGLTFHLRFRADDS